MGTEVMVAKARTVAKKSRAKNYRVGVILERRGHILAVGKNRPWLRAKPHGWMHAEADAVGKLKEFRLKKLSAYIVVLTKSGRDAVSWPCARCREVLRDSGVRNVFASIRGEVKEMRL